MKKRYEKCVCVGGRGKEGEEKKRKQSKKRVGKVRKKKPSKNHHLFNSFPFECNASDMNTLMHQTDLRFSEYGVEYNLLRRKKKSCFLRTNRKVI